MTTTELAVRRMGETFGRVDRVLLATVALFAVLALAVPGQAKESLLFTVRAFAFIAPFFVVSILFAAGAKASGLDRQIARAFTGRPAMTILLAAAFGSLSPFCSCGVIPIIAGLLAAGVPLAPVMAFWLSSPLMDPEMFILMAAMLGIKFTVAKAIAAFSLGLAGGFLTHALARRPAFAAPLKAAYAGCGGGCETAAPTLAWAFWRHAERRAAFRTEAGVTGWFLFKWLTFAFVLESLMVAYLPAESIALWLGNDNWWVVPASVAVGVPAYLNGYAAIPTVDALLGMGMAPGAGLAFMVAGGVTSIPAAMAVFALVRRPVFFWYLALGLCGSLATGLVYQAVAA
ncbi:MAG: permease [Alphaproteobacteria bacterium]